MLKRLCYVSHSICRLEVVRLKARKFIEGNFAYIPTRFLNNIISMTSTIPIIPLIYRTVDSTLDVFNKDENKDINEVKQLLTIYNDVLNQFKKNNVLAEVKKWPLIVLEGLDGSGKTSMSKRLAKKVNGKQWRTPPESISHLRSWFDGNATLRTAFYSLGNYIAALEVQLILQNQPVVMDRYWHSTAAYAIAQAVQDDPNKYKMPPKGHEIYCWPDDLFKPNIVILLNVSEKVRVERHSRRQTSTAQEDLLKAFVQFRQNILQAYKNMYNPEITIVNGDYSFGATLGNLERTVKALIY